MGNSCMGVHRMDCQIRGPTTPDKSGLDQGQIHSARWPPMTEPDSVRQATSVLRASRASKGTMDDHVRALIRGDTYSAFRGLNNQALLGWLE